MRNLSEDAKSALLLLGASLDTEDLSEILAARDQLRVAGVDIQDVIDVIESLEAKAERLKQDGAMQIERQFQGGAYHDP